MHSIVTSVKNLNVFLKVPELQGAVAVLKANGQPFCYTGGFNMVFKLEHNQKKWAFRVWHVPFGEKKERFKKIANYLKNKNLPYFAEFIYDTKGLLVNGTLHDTIRMEWLEGQPLKEFIKENLYNKELLLDFAEKFLQMTQTLRQNKISHGDLQHGNLLIDNENNIKLVDYDSICIPETEGQEEIVSGLKGYQHPSRFEYKKSTLVADYFSELVIYLSVLAIIENPDLWEKYRVEDSEYMLFSENDFVNFKSSEIYKDLQHLSPAIHNLLFVLDVYTRNPNYLSIRPMEEYPFLQLTEAVKKEVLSFAPNVPLPLMIQFSSSRISILEGEEIQLTWKVKNASRVYLLDNDADLEMLLNNSPLFAKEPVPAQGSLQRKLTETTNFTLYCIPIHTVEKSYKSIEVDVYPIPQISSFDASSKDIKQGELVSLSWDVKNAKNTYIWSGGVCNTVKNKDEIKLSLSRTTKYKLEVIALNNEAKLEKEIEIKVHNKVQIIDFEMVDDEYLKAEASVKFRWNVMNATKVILKSDREPDKDVSKIKEIVLNPSQSTSYWIEASNQCFQAKSQIINVDIQTSIVKKVKKVVGFFNK
ncbi:MAG: hypothetical protein Q4C98_02110 [Capnocytophaga sp.]|nr:hypothetical protein [Capnocytophaga sp.]